MMNCCLHCSRSSILESRKELSTFMPNTTRPEKLKLFCCRDVMYNRLIALQHPFHVGARAREGFHSKQ